MSIVLIKEGNRYRPEVEMDPNQMPEKLVAADFKPGELPKIIEIWGAGIDPNLAIKLQELSDSLEIHGDKK